MHRLVILLLLLGVAAAQNTSSASGGTSNSTGAAAGSDSKHPSQTVPAAASSVDTERDASAKREREGKDSLLDLPSLPSNSKLSVVGGRVITVDQIRDRIELQPFGGKKTDVAFDVRTQVYRDGVKIPPKEIHPGDRIYADTLLDNDHRVFAKNIRVVTKLRDTDRGHGQVITYDASNGKLTMRDELVSQPITLHVTRSTIINKNQESGSVADLKPGALIAVSFVPGGDRIAQEISVLAVPGTSFIFSGPVTHLNLSTHLLVVANKTDGKSYEIDYDPARVGANNDVREGSDVTVNATFNGQRYVAQNVTLSPEPKQQ